MLIGIHDISIRGSMAYGMAYGLLVKDIGYMFYDGMVSMIK